jgi:predicted transcriptional regulator
LKQMGRPKKPNPKATQITVRLDDDTLTKLEKSSESLNLTRVEVIRKGIDKVYSEIKK